MSSIRDIMDVDVEPLESQAYRRSREAAQQDSPTSPSVVSIPDSSPSTIVQSEESNRVEIHPIKRRRSHRPSHPDLPPTDPDPPSASSRPKSRSRPQSSIEREEMDYQTAFQPGASLQPGTTAGLQRSSRGSEPAADLPVKYTPVTGRISRAKKGVPVHTCDICRPMKTFTRAEHLR